MSDIGQREWKVLDFREGAVEDNPKGGGQLQKFYVDFEGSPDTYWRRKLPAVIEVGKHYFGTVSKGNYGPIFKKESPGQGGGSGGSQEASAGSSGYGKPPDVQRQIIRQHSQSAALQAVALLAEKPVSSAEELQRVLTQWTDWFDADVIGQTSNPTQDPQGQGDTSPPPAPPASDSGSADLQGIHEALDTAGLLYPAAKDFVADYMLSDLPPERIKKAVGNLVGQDLELQAQTLSALRASAEQWSGKLVPVADDEPVF